MTFRTLFEALGWITPKEPPHQTHDWKYDDDADTWYRFHVKTGQIVASCFCSEHGQWAVKLYANGHTYYYVDRKSALRAVEKVKS